MTTDSAGTKIVIDYSTFEVDGVSMVGFSIGDIENLLRQVDNHPANIRLLAFLGALKVAIETR